MKLSKVYRDIVRLPLNLKNSHKLKNKDFTIISSNCVGGVIYHELGQQFRSPTVNLWFEPKDFLKFAESFDYYIKQNLVEIVSKYSYPVAKLDDITIYFMHFNSFNEAKEKWESRCKRINHNNLFFSMTLSKDMPNDIVYAFDKLPHKNKIILTEHEFEAVDSAKNIPMSRDNNEIYDLCRYKTKFSGKRWLDDFDFIDFFNVDYFD